MQLEATVPENEPALALIEFCSIAVGMLAADAMVKKAPIARIVAGTTQPGKYLVLISGEVADVQESLATGREVGSECVLDVVFLPHVHPAVVEVVGGARTTGSGEAIGIIETRQVASTIRAADAGVKGAEVTLRELRLADGLGGKAFCLFQGTVSDVEAAVEIGVGALADREQLVREVVIPQMHPEMVANIDRTTYFGRLAGREGGEA
jgi:microcompartment protein CcmL/EutN